MFGVFRVKNNDFTPKKIIFFPTLGGWGGGGRRVRPPWIRPWYRIMKYIIQTSKQVTTIQYICPT